jgi:hypothetical protein
LNGFTPEEDAWIMNQYRSCKAQKISWMSHCNELATVPGSRPAESLRSRLYLILNSAKARHAPSRPYTPEEDAWVLREYQKSVAEGGNWKARCIEMSRECGDRSADSICSHARALMRREEAGPVQQAQGSKDSAAAPGNGEPSAPNGDRAGTGDASADEEVRGAAGEGVDEEVHVSDVASQHSAPEKRRVHTALLHRMLQLYDEEVEERAGTSVTDAAPV